VAKKKKVKQPILSIVFNLYERGEKSDAKDKPKGTDEAQK